MTASRFCFTCLAAGLAFSSAIPQSFADDLSERAGALRQAAPPLQELLVKEAGPLAKEQANDLAGQLSEKLTPSQVTVAFGAGLNTAQPGNAANHHVLPATIRVRKGGVVTFQVAGFHQVIVYKPGTRAENIGVPTTGLFIVNPDTLPLPGTLFYRGIKPAGGPPPGFPVTIDPSNAVNRAESVSFPEAGTYLVICNVGQHFRDGMYAYVEVK